MTAAAHRRAAFLFRRDLRLDDNTALAAACDTAAEVVPCFVFDPRQARGAHPYFGEPAFQLLIESLEDLEDQLAAAGGRLVRFEGEPHRVVARLIEEAGVDAVYVNRDYTPFSRLRDAAIERVCVEHRVPFETRDDLLLAPPGAVVTGAGTPYRTFTPFWRQARTRPVPRPGRFGGGDRLFRGRIGFAAPRTIYRRLLPRRRDGLWVAGGRRRGRELLDGIGRLDRYQETRDLPADQDGTSSLSAHHKLGTVSIRESWHAIAAALGEGSELLRQLWWRDFFTQLAWSWPHVFGEPFDRSLAAVEWDDDPDRLAAWCEGRTGFPLVDAGMRQLAATGWMHNRVRMAVGSFLTKDLHLDWRLGERWFATRLVDYDPAVNNGNWQWVASTGADAQPYFRIFNPWRQQRRFDPEARYVRRWVPELEGLDAEAIHALDKSRPAGLGYPEPMVDHRRESLRARRRFEAAR